MARGGVANARREGDRPHGTAGSLSRGLGPLHAHVPRGDRRLPARITDHLVRIEGIEGHVGHVAGVRNAALPSGGSSCADPGQLPDVPCRALGTDRRERSHHLPRGSDRVRELPRARFAPSGVLPRAQTPGGRIGPHHRPPRQPVAPLARIRLRGLSPRHGRGSERARAPGRELPTGPAAVGLPTSLYPRPRVGQNDRRGARRAVASEQVLPGSEADVREVPRAACTGQARRPGRVLPPEVSRLPHDQTVYGAGREAVQAEPGGQLRGLSHAAERHRCPARRVHAPPHRSARTATATEREARRDPGPRRPR